jgi:hypothetical protein
VEVNKQDFLEVDGLIQNCGWEKGESKNPLMYSYFQENRRLNYYFTSGTITIDERGKKCLVYRDLSILEIEKVIT